MGGAKKIFKKVKKLWKSVSKLISGITEVLNKALKGLVNVLRSTLDAVMGFLGFKDEIVTMVAGNTQSLMDEEIGFTFKENIILRAAIQDLSFVDTMRETIIEGQHNDFRRYFRYGEKGYYLGLPTVQYGAGTAFEVDKLKHQIWEQHCITHKLPNDIKLGSPLPVKDEDFEVEQVDIRTLIMRSLASKYKVNESAGTITEGQDTYYVDWKTMVTSSSVTEDNDPDDTWDLIQTRYSVSGTNSDKYVATSDPMYSPTSNKITFPSNNGAFKYVMNGVSYNDGTSVVWDSSMHGKMITLQPDVARKGYPSSWIPREDDGTVKITVSSVEERSSHEPPKKDFTGVVYDTLGRHINYSFKVTNGRYTPYPNNLTHTFSYSRKVPYAGDNYYTGNGANNPVQELSTFADVMPVVLFKNSGVWVDSDKKSEWYKTSTKLLKTIGVDLQILLDNIRDSDGGAASNVTTMAFRLGVDLLSENQECLKYCFNFFEYLYFNSVVSKKDYETSSNKGRGTDLNIYSIQEGSFNIAYSTNYITKTVETGVANKRNHYEVVLSGDNCTIYKYIGGGKREKLYIAGLIGYYSIYIPKAKKSDVAAISFQKSEDPDVTSNFVLPMLNGLLKTLTPLEREAVVTRGNYLTVFSADYQKIRWYKTAKFMKVIGFVIAVVVAIVTWNPSAGAAISAAWAAGAVAFAGYLITNLAIALVTSKVAQIIIEQVISALGDNALAYIVAIAAAAVAAYYGGKLLNKPIEVSDALLSSARVSSQVYSSRIQSLLEDISGRFDKLLSDYADISKEHQRALEELSPKNSLNILELIVDTPERYFSKADMDTTELLTDEALTLPPTDFEYVLA